MNKILETIKRTCIPNHDYFLHEEYDIVYLIPFSEKVSDIVKMNDSVTLWTDYNKDVFRTKFKKSVDRYKNESIELTSMVSFHANGKMTVSPIRFHDFRLFESVKKWLMFDSKYVSWYNNDEELLKIIDDLKNKYVVGYILPHGIELKQLRLVKTSLYDKPCDYVEVNNAYLSIGSKLSIEHSKSKRGITYVDIDGLIRGRKILTQKEFETLKSKLEHKCDFIHKNFTSKITKLNREKKEFMSNIKIGEML